MKTRVFIDGLYLNDVDLKIIEIFLKCIYNKSDELHIKAVRTVNTKYPYIFQNSLEPIKGSTYTGCICSTLTIKKYFKEMNSCMIFTHGSFGHSCYTNLQDAPRAKNLITTLPVMWYLLPNSPDARLPTWATCTDLSKPELMAVT